MAKRRMMRTAGLLCIALLAGCDNLHSSGDMFVRAYLDGQGPSADSFPTQFADPIDAVAPGALRLRAAANETVAFQLAIPTSGRVNVAVGPLLDEEGAVLDADTRVFHILPVEITDWPAWYVRTTTPDSRDKKRQDVLVPADAPKGGLPAAGEDGLLRVWIDITVPRGSRPGLYTGEVAILAGDKAMDSTVVELEVWPFMLPDDVGTMFVADIDHRALFAHQISLNGRPHDPVRILQTDPAHEVLQQTLRNTVDLVRSHGVIPQLAALTPIIKVGADEEIHVDWADYDRVVAPYLSAGTNGVSPLPIWRGPLTANFPSPPNYGALASPMFSRLLRAYLADLGKHFAENGWIAQTYLELPTPEDDWNAARRRAEYYGYVAREADPAIRLMARLFPQDMSPSGWQGYEHIDLSSQVNFWAPPAQFLDPASALGNRMWMSADRPPYSGTTALCGNAADTWVLAWQAAKLGVDAVHLGTLNPWPDRDHAPAKPQDCAAAGHGPLLYPGEPFGLPTPVASVRLKRLRRAHQDLAYLQLLRRHNRGHVAGALLDAITPFAAMAASGATFVDARAQAWPADADLWRLARRVMADELLGVVRGAPGEEVGATVRWRRLMDGTHGILASVDGVRVHPSMDGLGAVVESIISVENRRRVPLEGTLEFIELPRGWQAITPSVHVDQIAPGQSRQLILEARLESLAWGENGLRVLPLRLLVDDGPVLTLQARMCHITPQQRQKPLIIDGNLSDWGEGFGNYAGDFQSVARAASLGPDEDARALADTLCFTAMDPEFIYFGLRCGLAPGAPAPHIGGSTARVEDLVPQGGELIEILIDPRNSGSHSPGDLYRIVVQPGGAAWGHGIPQNPQIGPAEDWPAAIQQSVRVNSDHWTAEVRVPRTAFPEQFRSNAIWGVNFTRFDAASGEFSNWAAAEGNVYDPMSLGNMTIP